MRWSGHASSWWADSRARPRRERLSASATARAPACTRRRCRTVGSRPRPPRIRPFPSWWTRRRPGGRHPPHCSATCTWKTAWPSSAASALSSSGTSMGSSWPTGRHCRQAESSHFRRPIRSCRPPTVLLWTSLRSAHRVSRGGDPPHPAPEPRRARRRYADHRATRPPQPSCWPRWDRHRSQALPRRRWGRFRLPALLTEATPGVLRREFDATRGHLSRCRLFSGHSQCRPLGAGRSIKA